MLSWKRLGALLGPLSVGGGLLALWQGAAHLAGHRSYLLPSPGETLAALIARADLLAHHAAVTGLEIGLGLVLGSLLGCLAALAIALSPLARRVLLPLLVISQAIPVFAIAPLLVLWLGYGLASKVAMTSLILFFPVSAAFLDGLRRTEPAWLDLARVMGASPLATLLRIRVPAALPALASGLRVATAVAPIGAVVGEWVGSSAGLGYLMLHANARMQVPLMFAALAVLATFSVLLYATVDRVLRALLPWQADSLPKSW
ncbi:ABC transporter permease [Pararhodospirillum oryzae]|uniref:ABC transporter permease n=1 Tax=Pararhodospirillum oryzae TaxID=478448 RepID=A0A512HB17_9PROT|nr:ABC transporter permease [Pararhodospirillum oryzae]GEO82653.1 ABC transporter permease [Pararhodospirillum oryzae]